MPRRQLGGWTARLRHIGRPPPPLPPSAAAPTRTSSTASKRSVSPGVTPTTIAALPSARDTTVTMPEPMRPFQIVGERAQIAARHVIDDPAIKGNRTDPLAVGRWPPARCRGTARRIDRRPQRAARLGQLAFEPAIVVDQAGKTSG